MARLRRPFSGFLVLLAVAALLGVAGCGGGGEAQNTPTTQVAAAPVATIPAANALPPEQFSDLIGTKLAPSDQTPADVRKALSDGRPLALLVFVPASTDDDAVRAAFNKLKGQHKDVTFLAYDFKQPQKYGDLPQLLQVQYPPQLVFVDGEGVVRGALTGFADEATINQQVANIAQ